jgi:hypothetical protein
MAVMSIRVEVVCIADDGSEERREMMTIERRELAMETLAVNPAGACSTKRWAVASKFPSRENRTARQDQSPC